MTLFQHAEAPGAGARSAGGARSGGVGAHISESFETFHEESDTSDSSARPKHVVDEHYGGPVDQGDKFNGSISNSVVGGRGNTNIPSIRTFNEGLEFLYQNAAPGALHNSGERFDPPKCHQDTRAALQEEIIAWLDDLNSDLVAMWMHGPMGAGKSAIAQTIAELCFRKQRLSSSFFFARGSAERNNTKKLVATLVYQMSLQIPETKPFISAAILNDRLIFQSSLERQINTLIIGPLSRVPNPVSQQMLIIIDGLDECEDNDIQDLIVKTFISAIASMRSVVPQMPHKIFIASRPETNIRTAFDNPIVSLSTKRLLLDNSWNPDADIRTFLYYSFTEIRRTHPLKKLLSPDWPRVVDIDELVCKSSSQFIYASVVIKFLRSPRNHPIESLKVILGLVKDTTTRPYAELDALYAHIFSRVEDLSLVLQVFCLRLMENSHCDIGKVSDIEHILQLAKGKLHIALNDLVSVISLDEEDDKISFHHASLQEYLKDPVRSGVYHVNSRETCANVARHCINSLVEAEQCGDPSYNLECLSILPIMVECSSMEAQMSIFLGISKINYMSAIEHMLNFRDEKTCQELSGEAIKWICAKHVEFSTSIMPHILSKAVKEIYEWIMTQFKAFPSSGADNVDGTDIWVLAGRSDPGIRSFLNEYATIDEKILLLFDRVTPSIEMLWGLTCWIPDKILENSELLGNYTVTEERRLHAATHLCQQLLNFTPKTSMIFDRILPLWAILVRLFRTLKPNKGLCIMLEETIADNISATLDVTRIGDFSGSSCRVHAYFCRKYQFTRDHDNRVRDVAGEIFKYMKRTREAIETTFEHDLKWEQNSNIEAQENPGIMEDSPEAEQQSVGEAQENPRTVKDGLQEERQTISKSEIPRSTIVLGVILGLCAWAWKWFTLSR